MIDWLKEIWFSHSSFWWYDWIGRVFFSLAVVNIVIIRSQAKRALRKSKELFMESVRLREDAEKLFQDALIARRKN